MDYQDLENAVSDLQDNIGSYDVSDTLDGISDTIDNQNDTNTDLDQRLTDVENTTGQLTIPLTQDTIDAIKEQFPVGQVEMTLGVATITDSRISTSSIIIYCRAGNFGTPTGEMQIATTNGSATIYSAAGTEHSYINYLIMS
jgi:hypothetical protein